MLRQSVSIFKKQCVSMGSKAPKSAAPAKTEAKATAVETPALSEREVRMATLREQAYMDYKSYPYHLAHQNPGSSEHIACE